MTKHSLDASARNIAFIAPNAGWPIRSGDKGGITFDFPQSSPVPDVMDEWLAYLAIRIPLNVHRPLVGTNLVFEMQVITSGTKWNYISDGINNPPPGNGINPAGCTPMLKMGDPWNDNLGMRWFCNQRWALQNSEQVKLDVSLAPTNWHGVEGQDPLTHKNGDDFRQTIQKPSLICLVFGGGFYAGHGVNCCGGPATFNLFNAYTY